MHAHADHIGFAEKIRKETCVKVYVNSTDEKMARKTLQLTWFGLLLNPWRLYTAKMLWVAIIKRYVFLTTFIRSANS